jgi:hypothetical protein
MVAATGLAHVPTRLPAALVRLTRRGYYVQNLVIDVCGSPAYNLGQVLGSQDQAPNDRI